MSEAVKRSSLPFLCQTVSTGVADFAVPKPPLIATMACTVGWNSSSETVAPGAAGVEEGGGTLSCEAARDRRSKPEEVWQAASSMASASTGQRHAPRQLRPPGPPTVIRTP